MLQTLIGWSERIVFTLRSKSSL